MFLPMYLANAYGYGSIELTPTIRAMDVFAFDQRDSENTLVYARVR